MSKAMSKELKREIQKLLKSLIEESPGSRLAVAADSPPLTREAALYLEDIGALQKGNTGGSRRVTAYGRAYYEELTTFALWYWFKRNWFPAIVALATIAASVGGVVANILD